MKRKLEDAEKTRFALIDAALKVFLRRGYADSTIEEICLEASTTRGAFYHYFDSKKAVYYALIEERLKPSQMMIFDILKSDFSPLAKIRKILENSLTLLINDRGFREASELTLLKTGFVEELSDGMEMKKESMKAMVFMLEDLLIKAAENKEISLRFDAHSSAMHLYSAITGAGSLWLIDRETFDFPESAEKFAEMWIQGIRKGE